MNVLKLPKQRLEEIILEEIQKFKLLTEVAQGVEFTDDQVRDLIDRLYTHKGDLGPEQLQALAPVLHQALPPATAEPGVG